MLTELRSTIAETVGRLVGGVDREDLLRQRAALLDGPPIAPTLREQREAAEQADDARAAMERAARDGQLLRLEREVLAAVPAVLLEFRAELARQRDAWVFVTTSAGGLARRAATFRIVERSVQWSARPTRAESDAAWLAKVVEVLTVAAAAAAGPMLYMSAAELAAAIAMHREQITAALAAERWADFPTENLWLTRSMPRLASWHDRPESY
jgi:hypothetical protein